MYTDWPPGVATVDTVSSVVFQCPLFTTFLLLLIPATQFQLLIRCR